MGQVPDQVMQEAADPATTEQRLFEIASQYPQTYSIIAANPRAYPDLLQWLSQVGDDFTRAVLLQRESGLSGADAYEAARKAFITNQDETTPDTDSSSAAIDEPQREETPADDVAPVAATDPANQVDEAADNADGDTEATTQLAPVPGNATTGDSDLTQIIAEPSEVTRTSVMPMQERQTPAHGTPMPPAVAPAYGAENTSAYAPWQQSYAPQPVKRGVPKLLIVLIVVLALTLASIAAVGSLLYFNVFSESTQNSSSPTVTSSQSGNSGDSDDEWAYEGDDSTTDTGESDEILYPAPGDAVGSRNFHMPSNNINCQLDEDQTRCTIFDTNFDHCGDDPTTVVLKRGASAELTCDANQRVNSGHGGVLIYDTSTTFSDFACTSSTSDVHCWNIRSGDGFRMSRENVSATTGG